MFCALRNDRAFTFNKNYTSQNNDHKKKNYITDRQTQQKKKAQEPPPLRTRLLPLVLPAGLGQEHDPVLRRVLLHDILEARRRRPPPSRLLRSRRRRRRSGGGGVLVLPGGCGLHSPVLHDPDVVHLLAGTGGQGYAVVLVVLHHLLLGGEGGISRFKLSDAPLIYILSLL